MHELLKKVYYHDTDAGGVVYYANYLKYFEEGRSEYMLARGINIKALAEESILFVVARVEIDYKAPARYGDVLKIISEVNRVKNVTLEFSQQAKKEGNVLVYAATKLVCIDGNFKPHAMPLEIIESLKK